MKTSGQWLVISEKAKEKAPQTLPAALFCTNVSS
jgi:hypothetical protein